jgi:hypothetical protein
MATPERHRFPVFLVHLSELVGVRSCVRTSASIRGEWPSSAGADHGAGRPPADRRWASVAFGAVEVVRAVCARRTCSCEDLSLIHLAPRRKDPSATEEDVAGRFSRPWAPPAVDLFGHRIHVAVFKGLQLG